MQRRILAAVVGFILWSALWLAYNAFLLKLGVPPQDQAQPVQESNALIALLAGSVVASLVAGLAAAAILKSSVQGPIVALGLLLLAVGIFFQAQYWQLMPLWYHLTFLLLLLPVCIAGARLSKA